MKKENASSSVENLQADRKKLSSEYGKLKAGEIQ
jgi:hypothetical protein